MKFRKLKAIFAIFVVLLTVISMYPVEKVKAKGQLYSSAYTGNYDTNCFGGGYSGGGYSGGGYSGGYEDSYNYRKYSRYYRMYGYNLTLNYRTDYSSYWRYGYVNCYDYSMCYDYVNYFNCYLVNCNWQHKRVFPGKIVVCKTWSGAPLKAGEEYPDVYFQLYKMGRKVGYPRLYKDGGLVFNIPNVNEISQYTVKEVNSDGSPWSKPGYRAGNVERDECSGIFKVTNCKERTRSPIYIGVYKRWDGVSLKSGEKHPDVYFQLTKDGEDVGEPKLYKKGKTLFAIPDKNDLYRYSVREVNEDGSSWSAEGYRAGVVRRKESGLLFCVTNTKLNTVKPGHITVTKTWKGEDLEDDEEYPDVYFQLLKNGEPVGRIKKYEGEKVVFDIPDEKDIEDYSVKEVNEDGSPWSAEGYERGDVDYDECDGSYNFTNIKKPEEVESVCVSFKFKKRLKGRKLNDGEFKFELRDSDGELVETVKNKGKFIKFSKIEFDKEGTYKYYVKEVKGKNSKVTYDSSVKEVVVEVTKENGKLSASVTYPSGSRFKNEYPPIKVKIRKTDENNEGLAGAKLSIKSEEGFKYEWVTDEGAKVLYLAEGHYKITEIYTPDDSKYKYASPIEFDVKYDKKRDKLQIENVVIGEGNNWNKHRFTILDKYIIEVAD